MTTKLAEQVESLVNFNQELVPGGSVKGLMKSLDGKSRDLWFVKPGDIHVMPGLNPRVHDQAYQEGLQELAEDMVENGYYTDKPLTGFIATMDGKDQIVLGDGHRRFAAAQLAIKMGAPLEYLPLVLKDKSEMSMESLTKSLLHSNEGVPFTVFEKAVIAKRFKSYGWDDTKIAKELRVTPAFVGQLHTLSSSPMEIQRMVKEGTISATHAIETVKQHGEKAEEILTAAVVKAKAKGKGKATAKDTDSAARTRRAKSLGPKFYAAVVLLFADRPTMQVIDRTVYEELDALVTQVENGKVRKEPKAKAPKAPKEAKAKKVPLAKKVARASKKAEAKKAPWDAGYVKPGRKSAEAHAQAGMTQRGLGRLEW